MNKSKIRFYQFVLAIILIALSGPFTPAYGQAKLKQPVNGANSLDQMAQQFLLAHPSMKYLGYPQWGGSDFRDPKSGKPLPGFVNPALVRGASPLGTVFPPTAAAAMGWKTESRLTEGMYYSHLSGLGGFNGWENSDLKAFAQNLQAGDVLANTMLYPLNAANQAKAQTTSQFIAAGNALGETTKEQAANAIDYTSKYLQNFTVDEGNKWNQIRNNLFVPIGILLLLPGAVLCQVRAMMASGSPVIGDYNPFEGILRSVIAIFFIPASYLIVNYGIDFSNSIVLTMAGEYERLFGSNMYQDAMCAQIRAFPVRTPEENQNVGAAQTWNQTPVSDQKTYEQSLIESKMDDPCGGAKGVADNRTDEGMPADAVASRFLAFGSNAGLTLTWDVLCAFQMAYLLYLFFVGPVMAGLWVWPMKQLRDAFPNWVEGVITICFWSLFWNTVILLMACFKGVGETGTLIMAALNFLAVNAVKFAFDFSGLVKAAGMEAAKRATSGPQGASGAQGGGGAAGRAGATGSADSRSASAPSRNSMPSTESSPITTSSISQAGTRTGAAARSALVGPPPSAYTPKAKAVARAWSAAAAVLPQAPPAAVPAKTTYPSIPVHGARAFMDGATSPAVFSASPVLLPNPGIEPNGAPAIRLNTTAGSFYLTGGTVGTPPVLMVPANLLPAGTQPPAISMIGGVGYAPVSVPGPGQSITLANGSVLTFGGNSSGEWSLNVHSQSGIDQTILLKPTGNHAFRVDYLTGSQLSGSLLVSSDPSGSTIFTTLDGMGTKLREDLLSGGTMSTSYFPPVSQPVTTDPSAGTTISAAVAAGYSSAVYAAAVRRAGATAAAGYAPAQTASAQTTAVQTAAARSAAAQTASAQTTAVQTAAARSAAAQTVVAQTRSAQTAAAQTAAVRTAAVRTAAFYAAASAREYASAPSYSRSCVVGPVAPLTANVQPPPSRGIPQPPHQPIYSRASIDESIIAPITAFARPSSPGGPGTSQPPAAAIRFVRPGITAGSCASYARAAHENEPVVMPRAAVYGAHAQGTMPPPTAHPGCPSIVPIGDLPPMYARTSSPVYARIGQNDIHAIVLERVINHEHELLNPIAAGADNWQVKAEKGDPPAPALGQKVIVFMNRLKEVVDNNPDYRTDVILEAILGERPDAEPETALPPKALLPKPRTNLASVLAGVSSPRLNA